MSPRSAAVKAEPEDQRLGARWDDLRTKAWRLKCLTRAINPIQDGDGLPYDEREDTARAISETIELLAQEIDADMEEMETRKAVAK